MKTHVYKMMCIRIFMSALFIIAPNWKWFICPSTSEWLNKLWYICTIKYYSVIKRKKYQCIQQPEWISRELCWVKTVNSICDWLFMCMLPFICWNDKNIEMENRLVVNQKGRGRRKVHVALKGQHEGSVWWFLNFFCPWLSSCFSTDCIIVPSYIMYIFFLTSFEIFSYVCFQWFDRDATRLGFLCVYST